MRILISVLAMLVVGVLATQAKADLTASKGSDREWIAESSYCGPYKSETTDIKIDGDGTFSYVSRGDKGWSATVKGNLKHSEAEATDVTSDGTGTNRIKNIKISALYFLSV